MPTKPARGDLHGLAPEKLRAARQALGMTQKALGAEMGVSNVEIYRKELPAGAREHRPIRRVQVLAIRWLLHLASYSDRQIAKITGAD